MTKLRKSVLTVIALFILGNVFSQFTRQQAIDMVMDDIVGPDSINVNVFAAIDSRTQQQDVVLLDNRLVSCTYTDNWVFFIDDERNSFWYHPCRFIFVSSQNGDYTIVTENLFPADLETAYELVSSMPSHTPAPMIDYTGGNAPMDDPDDHLFAVLVGGTSQSAFWTDISMIYNTLLEKGYKKENIFVHYSDAGGSYGWQGMYGDDLDGFPVSDDIDYDASLASMQTTFDNLSGVSTSNPEIPKLEHGDQLLVHFDSHGNTYDLENMGSYILVYGSNGGEYLYDYQLATWMEPLECAQVLVTMQQCFSGGFKDDLTDYTSYPNTMCKNRRVITAADYDESAVMEIHVTGGNSAVTGGVYGEFDFYFYSALRGLYPDVNEFGGFDPWEPSANLGEFPFYLYPTMVGHPGDYDPDVVLGNDDGIVQVGEGFDYMDDLDTWSPNGYYYPYPGYTYAEHPQNEKTELFIEDLFTLSGLTGEVKNDQTVTGNFLIGGNITIESTADVNIANSSGFYFQDGNSRIYVDGELHIGNNALLKGQDDAFLSLLRTNTNGVLTIGTGTEFNKMRIELTGYPLMDHLLLDNLVFNDFDINGQLVSLDVLNSEFNNGWLQVSNCDDLYMDGCNYNYSNLMVSGNSFTTELSKAIITDCNFSHLNATSDAIWIEQMPKYDFARNNIHGYATGLWVFNSGDAKKAGISNNEIYGNSVNGIGVYNSLALISNNKIYNNAYGVKLHNNSNVELRGNPDAIVLNQTQTITDNASFEVYASQHSFPYYFRYNGIIDEDNAGAPMDPMVYYNAGSGGMTLKDVRYNCWGDNFSSTEDLYPSGYIWNPTWCPPLGSGGVEEDEQLFMSAKTQMEEENFTDAKNSFQLLIEQYPSSKYANAAMKELLGLEKLVGNDYNGLKQYYKTNGAIQSNTELEELSGSLANKCDVELENWQDVVTWYETIIEYPVNLEDSIFSVIDLGYAYLLMENGGNKSAYTGSMPEHKPSTIVEFVEKRDFLLSLLPSGQLSETMKGDIAGLKEGQLLQNVPNPFKGSTQIWYKLENESIVQLNVYNYTGQLIKSFNEGTKTKGSHHIDFNANGLKSGIYFYSISINGQISDSKKMTVME